MSDERRQNPENSIPGQNRSIDERIINSPGHPLHGIRVVRTFELLHRSHDGLSGVAVFDEMIAWARAGRFRYILLDKYDRFGRNIYEAMELEKELNRLGVYIVSAKEQFDVAQPAGWLAKTLMQVLADFYARNLASEVKKGMREKLERGEWPWGAPFGYRHKENKSEGRRPQSILIEDETTGPQLRRAFMLFATGRWTLESWADYAYTALDMRGRRGGRIPDSTWTTIFHNPIYIGRLQTRMFAGMEFEAHPDTPRLVKEDVFDRVAAVLESRWNGAEQHNIYSYPLSPILWNEETDSGMGGATTMKGRRAFSYYRAKTPVPGTRSRLHIATGKVDASFANLMDRITLSPERIASVRERVEGFASTDRRTHEPEVRSLRERERRLRQASQELVTLRSLGDITHDEFQRSRSLNASALREIRDKLSALTEPTERLVSDADVALRLLGRLGDLWRELDNDEDREMLARLLFKRVTVRRTGTISSWKLHQPFADIYSLAMEKAVPNLLRLSLPDRIGVPDRWLSPATENGGHGLR